MKTGTHPEYHQNAVITCACGNKMTIGSTQQEIFVELCAACHPFYTGKQKLVDTAGRVDKFTTRATKQVATALERKGKRVKAEAKKSKQAEKEA